MNTPRILLLLCLSAGLAACGGGTPDEAPPAAGHEVPASATVSPAAYSQFAGSLATTETGQPLDVSKVVPPTSETAQPVPVA
jgi:hypothetical protein